MSDREKDRREENTVGKFQRKKQSHMAACLELRYNWGQTMLSTQKHV